MPRSGNRLVRRLLVRHGFLAEIRHYGNRQAFPTGGWATRAIMPLRFPSMHWRSCTKWPENDLRFIPPPPNPVLGRAPRTPIEMHFEHFEPTLRYAAELGIPVLPVAYEAIVADYEEQGKRIVEFAGARIVPWKGWGEEVILDGNEKYAAAPPVDWGGFAEGRDE